MGTRLDWLMMAEVAVVVAMFALLRLRRSPFVLLLIPALCQAAQPFVSAEKETLLRQLIPDKQLAAESRLILYTQREMPRAYQFAGPGQRRAGFHSASYNISGDYLEARKGHGRGGNGNVEFPWNKPGGTDRTEGTDSVKFILLPEGKPVAWYVRPANIPFQRQVEIYAWVFPVGTVVGEVLTWRLGAYDIPFEMRTRTRAAGSWSVDIFRPYPTAASLRDAVAALPEFAGREALLRHLEAAEPASYRLADDGHRSRRAFESTASLDVLPEVPADVATTLLLGREFERCTYETWRGDDCFAASGAITPANYDGTFLGTDEQSCRRCHESAAHHVDEFDGPRQWYGFVRGSDEILSFHPVLPEYISPSGGHVTPRMRDLAGIIERYDANRHDAETYHELRD